MIRHRRKSSVSTPRKLAPPTATLCICIVHVCLLSWLITEIHIIQFSEAAAKVVFFSYTLQKSLFIFSSIYIFSLILSPVFSGLLPLLMTVSSNLLHLSNVG